MNESTPATIQRLIEAMPLTQCVSARKAADVLGCTESDVLAIVADGDLFSWTHSPTKGEQAVQTDDRTGEVTLLPRITPDTDPLAISVDGEGLLWIACVRFEQLLSGQDLPPKDVVEARLASVTELARARALRPPNPTSQAQPAPAKTNRSDLLQSLIDKAIGECGTGHTDVFCKLREWASEKPPRQPLRGVTENGIQWVNSNDKPCELTIDALKKRIKRRR